MKILLHMHAKCSRVLLHVFAYRILSFWSVKTLPNTDDIEVHYSQSDLQKERNLGILRQCCLASPPLPPYNLLDQ